jgi:multicomponent Na+:H+ antiporter subunit B
MKYFILSQASRLLFPALLVLSLIVLYRGHNLPGGGFIGGLLAATAFILVGLANSMEQAKAKLRIEPVALMALGLLVAVASGLPGLLTSAPFMTGMWLPASPSRSSAKCTSARRLYSMSGSTWWWLVLLCKPPSASRGWLTIK